MSWGRIEGDRFLSQVVKVRSCMCRDAGRRFNLAEAGGLFRWISGRADVAEFLRLVVIKDWATAFALSWRLSDSIGRAPFTWMRSMMPCRATSRPASEAVLPSLGKRHETLALS